MYIWVEGGGFRDLLSCNYMCLQTGFLVMAARAPTYEAKGGSLSPTKVHFPTDPSKW